jgi:hypothetical protein
VSPLWEPQISEKNNQNLVTPARKFRLIRHTTVPEKMPNGHGVVTLISRYLIPYRKQKNAKYRVFFKQATAMSIHIYFSYFHIRWDSSLSLRRVWIWPSSGVLCAVWSGRNLPVFHRCLLPPSSGQFVDYTARHLKRRSSSFSHSTLFNLCSWENVGK